MSRVRQAGFKTCSDHETELVLDGRACRECPDTSKGLPRFKRLVDPSIHAATGHVEQRVVIDEAKSPADSSEIVERVPGSEGLQQRS